MKTTLICCLVVTILLCAPTAPAAEPRVIDAASLVTLGPAAPELTTDTCRLSVTLDDLLRWESKKKRTQTADLNFTLDCVGGRWRDGKGRTPGYNQGTHDIRVRKLVVEPDGIAGEIVVVIQPDKWVPKDGKPRKVTLRLNAKVTETYTEKGQSVDITGARFWKLHPSPQPIARKVEGVYHLVSGGEAVQGSLTGQLTPAAAPGRWDMGSAGDDGGLKLSFDMGSTKQNWNFARLATYPLAEPVDLTEADGLRVRLTTDQPRTDVSATVWVREADGSWYYVRSAVPLADPNNQGVLPWEDFTEAEWVSPGNHMDEDYVLDRSAISHVGVGLVAPEGPGEVSFTMAGIEAVQLDRPEVTDAVAVVTGRTLAVNGHQMVPVGLFGGYAPELPQKYRPGCQRHLFFGLGGGPKTLDEDRSEDFLIDCWGDRYHPAIQLLDPNWKSKFDRIARRYARKVGQRGYNNQLEIWNEPYLNWARGDGAKNYKVKRFRVDLAEEGGPVTIKATGDVVPHFKWTKKSGQWRVVDETQFTYWSGKGNGWLYDQFAIVVAKAVKETDPKVQVIAGWDFRWQEDNWAAWEMLYKPTIDQTAQWIDGVSEHHYQGDTTAMNGAYEVLTAYGKTAHDRWLYSYNTETNDLVDVPSRGPVDTPAKAKAAKEYRRMTYNFRDIVYCVHQSPDKARSRTMIHHNHTPKATEITFGLLSNLRGRLVETACDDDDVWVVSSIDGTDPDAPSPADGPEMVVVVFNDQRVERKVSLTIWAPQGTVFTGSATAQPAVDEETFELSVKRDELRFAARKASFRLTLPPRGSWKATLPISGELPAEPEVQRKQVFSPTILQDVTRKKPVTFAIPVESNDIRQVQRAWLRLVVERVDPGEARVELAGRSGHLPKARTADNCNRILEVPVPLELLSPQMEVTFSVDEGNHDGYRVDMASVVLEARTDDYLPPMPTP